jgi:ribonuclease P protein component
MADQPEIQPQVLSKPQGFPKDVRLLRPGDFRKVYDCGVRHSCPLFAAFCLADPGLQESGRKAIGFTTPKALGNAVRRNRIRRRVREAARLELAGLNPGWSIVFNPRRKVLDCIFTDLRHEVKRLFIRCATSPVPAAASRASLAPSSEGISA